MSFTTPEDIANRCLQHLGVPMIYSFADNSKNAVETRFIYDKVRRAELERNIWRFSTRRTALRPVTATTQNILFPLWLIGTTYAAGAVVRDSNNLLWVSIKAGNVGNTPSTSSLFWQEYFGPVVADAHDVTLSYYTGELVTSGGNLYVSITNSNLNHAPPNATYWLLIDTTTNACTTLYNPSPIVANQQGVARNAFVLPSGFLRIATQDVKIPGTSILKTSAGMPYSDFAIEDLFLLTSTASPIIFRFAADLSDVTRMSDMFCEGVGCRMALNLCETFTQSPQKKQQITQDYNFFMTEARHVDEIEVGSTEPPEEAYQTSRYVGTNAPVMAQPQRPG